MNYPISEFFIQGIILYEFLIQGISHSGNFSFREFLFQGISHSGNFSFREFLIQGISPPLQAGNFSSPPGKKFLLPSYEFVIQGISHSGNLEIQGISHSGNEKFREFLIPPGPPGEAGISHTENFSFREFLLPPGRKFLIPYMNFSSLREPPGEAGISHPSGASRGGGNFSFREFLISENFSFREFLLHPGRKFLIPYMNFSSLRGLQGRREFLIQAGNLSSPPGRKFLLPHMNFSFREFLLPPGPPGEAGISHSGREISHTLYEFVIQGICHSGNFSFREFLLPPGQGISHTLYEFLIQEFLLASMNFSSQPGR